MKERSYTGDFRGERERMRIHALCKRNHPYTEKIQFQLGKPRSLPEEWPIIKATVLERLKAEAKDRGAVFGDGPQLDMVSAHGDDSNTIHVKVALTSYFPFAAMSNRLDEEVGGLGPSPITLRDRWTGGNSINLYDVHTLKSPAVIGTVTVVVTVDDFVPGQARSAQVYQVSGISRPGEIDHRTGMHFLGKGMIPPTPGIHGDCDPSGTPDPYETAKRALRNDLGLEDEQIRETQVIPIGLGFDEERWQPVFSYIAQVPFSFRELKSRFAIAKDSFKAEESVPFWFGADYHELHQLLLKNMISGGSALIMP